jgi:cysteine desulfurase
MQRVYLDYNSTTPVDPEVMKAMLPYLSEFFGNPSNIHSFGRDAREAIAQARDKVAAFLNADPEEVYFTSCGSESDNWALKGVAAALNDRGRHIILSPIEHSAIAGTAAYLASHGCELSELKVDKTGLVNPDDVARLIRKDTILVTLMLANNEIGTIEPVQEIARICRDKGVICHTDAVAAATKTDLDVRALGVDLLTISGHKIHGPKGIGALFIRNGTPIHPLLHGGHQERGMRAGTENLAGIVGFGKACEIAQDRWRAEVAQIQELRDYLHKLITDRIEEVHFNGHPTKRLPNTLNIGVGYVEGESLLVSLDLEGVAVASGSACSAGEAGASATLKAINVPPQFLNSPLRFSLGRENTRQEIDYTVDVLEKVVKRLRDISPIWKDRGKRFFQTPPETCASG